MPSVNKSFVAAKQIRSIIAASAAKSWCATNTVSAGALTQIAIYKPLYEAGGGMLCECVIYGQDADADDEEAVTFIQTFYALGGVVSIENNNALDKISPKSQSETGFTYNIEGGNNNRSCYWVATGLVIMPL